MVPTPDPTEIERQETVAPFQCAVCGAPVLVHDGNSFRQCEHHDAAVLANMSAVVFGMSKLG